MPVLRRTSGLPNLERFQPLSEELARELMAPKEFGQPLIEEEEFPRTGLKGITVIWNKWNGVTDPERTGVVLDAYKKAFGESKTDQIAYALGLTVSEAAEVGKLPYTILPIVRRTDPVTFEEVQRAVIELGGEVPGKSDFAAILRFGTVEEAEACRSKLIQLLPGSSEIWNISQEVQKPEWARV